MSASGSQIAARPGDGARAARPRTRNGKTSRVKCVNACSNGASGSIDATAMPHSRSATRATPRASRASGSDQSAPHTPLAGRFSSSTSPRETTTIIATERFGR